MKKSFLLLNILLCSLTLSFSLFSMTSEDSQLSLSRPISPVKDFSRPASPIQSLNSPADAEIANILANATNILAKRSSSSQSQTLPPTYSNLTRLASVSTYCSLCMCAINPLIGLCFMGAMTIVARQCISDDLNEMQQIQAAPARYKRTTLNKKS